jgi:hypothetical protein
MSVATMPFGKHKGTSLDKVPADYLLWCHNEIAELRGPLKDYISDNLDAIKKEAKELATQKD